MKSGQHLVMTIAELQNEIIDEFSMFEDWEERYQYMIDLGKTLPLIDEIYKTDDHIIKGCQSKVWVHAEMANDKVNFTADSDAIITKGIIAILIRVFSGQHPKDIIDADDAHTDAPQPRERRSPPRTPDPSRSARTPGSARTRARPTSTPPTPRSHTTRSPTEADDRADRAPPPPGDAT